MRHTVDLGHATILPARRDEAVANDWPEIQYWTEAEHLAAAWLRHDADQRDAFDDDHPDAWASDELFERLLADPDAERDWPVILALVAGCRSIHQRYRVAAGPLEDYITRHGAAVIEQIEDQAGRDRRFRWMLQGVWQSGMSADVYLRMLRAAGAEVDERAYRRDQRIRRLLWPLGLARFVAAIMRIIVGDAVRRILGRSDGAAPDPVDPATSTVRVVFPTGSATAEIEQDGRVVASGPWRLAPGACLSLYAEAWFHDTNGWSFSVVTEPDDDATTTSVTIEDPGGPVAVAGQPEIEVDGLVLSDDGYRASLQAPVMTPFAPDLDARRYVFRGTFDVRPR